MKFVLLCAVILMLLSRPIAAQAPAKPGQFDYYLLNLSWSPEFCATLASSPHGMAVRTTIDLPEPLHDRLRNRAEHSGASIRSLIVYAIEQTYPITTKGRPVTGPLIRNSGKRGPQYPTDENPHDLVFS